MMRIFLTDSGWLIAMMIIAVGLPMGVRGTIRMMLGV
jgi:uncharacterized membrane protein